MLSLSAVIVNSVGEGWNRRSNDGGEKRPVVHMMMGRTASIDQGYTTPIGLTLSLPSSAEKSKELNLSSDVGRSVEM